MTPSITRRTALFAGAALATVPVFAALPAAAAEPAVAQLMVHFTGEQRNGEQIYLSYSADGLNWTELNDAAPVLYSTVGTRGVRDPALIRSAAGDRYWIIATDLHIGSGTSWGDAIDRGSRSLVVWESTDLVTWSAPWLLDVASGVPGATNAWAPEAIYDPTTGDHVVYWASKSARNGVAKHRIHAARTRDFRSVSTPFLYIDRPGTQELIDTQIIEVPERTGGYRYYRASADGQITVEASDTILGSWTRIGDLSGIGLTGRDVEGPMWMRFTDRNEWALWLDQYATGRGYRPVTSTNLGAIGAYRTVSGYSMGTSTKRHGGILALTAAERSRVLGRYGQSAPVTRLQSVNLPDRYVRHANFVARLDANVSPADDARFRLVRGLDGASDTVSLQSVNFPTYYLRHRDFALVLAPDDGGATLRADASFRRVTGLADSSASSLRSTNFPDRHVRHRDGLLRIDPITDAQGRADATFRFVS